MEPRGNVTEYGGMLHDVSTVPGVVLKKMNTSQSEIKNQIRLFEILKNYI